MRHKVLKNTIYPEIVCKYLLWGMGHVASKVILNISWIVSLKMVRDRKFLYFCLFTP